MTVGTADTDLRRRFDTAMRGILERAKNLRPPLSFPGFRRMLANADGKDVADRLLERPAVSKGFDRLRNHSKETGNKAALKLAVEYLVLEEPWRELFTDHQRAIARKRLIDAKLEPPAEDVVVPDLRAMDMARRVARHERPRSTRAKRLRNLPAPRRSHSVYAKNVESLGWRPLVLCDDTACYWNRFTVRDREGVVEPGITGAASEHVLSLIQGGHFGEDIKDAYADHVRWDLIFDDLIDVPQPEIIERFRLRELDVSTPSTAEREVLPAVPQANVVGRPRSASLANLTSRDAVLDAIREFDAIGRDAFLEKYGFGPAREYFLEHDGDRYDSKAIVGAAHKHQFPELGALKSAEFSGGDATVAAALTDLDFKVVRAGRDQVLDTKSAWSLEEVAATVNAYFAMLERELRGESYSKKEHNRRLQALLHSRSAAAIEFKHANISAVLIELGFPYIDGYKPRGNYQELLKAEVEERLARSDTLTTVAASAVQAPATEAQRESEGEIFVAPPERTERRSVYERRVTVPRKGTDYIELEARNGSLGHAGELFVLDLEHRRLWEAGHRELAERIEHVSATRGDGLGFDIMSFEADGSERLIEVKTTGFGKMTPFYASRTEVAVSEERATQFSLYRVFKFRESPKVFVLTGSLRDTCLLDPVQFRAAFR